MIDADSRSKSMVQTSSVPHNVERHIEQPQSTPRKVLIIDREEDSQEMITALEAEGFRVIQAPDSAAGLRKAAEPDLSLIVVGEQIFVGGEQEAFPRLCAISESPIVLLHSGGQGLQDQAKNIGAEVYFSRNAPINYFIHYVCGRLNWGGRLRAAARTDPI
jgi:PleD family two-component response regulator